MKWFSLAQWRRKRKPPVIATEYGPVTESARHQAALNMAADHALRERVVRLIANQCNLSLTAAWEEAKRRYPEAFED